MSTLVKFGVRPIEKPRRGKKIGEQDSELWGLARGDEI
jgi:hypothetical protein